jgi:hypothetical protein
MEHDLQKLGMIVPKGVKTFPVVYGTGRLRVHEALLEVLFLGQINSVHTLSPFL